MKDKQQASQRAARWVREDIRRLTAYHVPPSQGFVKLDAMENPYTLPEPLIGQWLEALRGAALNRYPDPTAGELIQRLRTVMGVPADQAVILGNGSDELIQMIALAVAGQDRVLLAPEPTFAMYRLIAAVAGLRYEGVPLAADFGLDRQAMIAAIERHQPAVVFLAYPNNPTGNLFHRDDVEAVLEAAPGLVVLDEAYHAFAGASFMAELGRHDNLLVMRTVSKLGLAGLRLGLLAGDGAWIDQLEKIRLPYNINVLTQKSAAFVLSHGAVFEQQTAQICRDREGLLAALGAMDGIEVFPSQANFVLFRVAAERALPLFEALKRRKVLIKCLHGSHPALAGCLRVTVGTAGENEAFLQALKQAVAPI